MSRSEPRQRLDGSAGAPQLKANGQRRAGPQTKRDFALEMLRSSIIEAEFRPGQRLYIEELADRLQMSETPIREALRQLEAEGLVYFLPHRGVLVAESNPKELHTIYMMREALESLAVRLAVPKMTDADVRNLGELHRQLVQAGERDDLPEFRRLNREFHVTLYRLADSHQLFEFLRILWAKIPADLLMLSSTLKEVTVVDHAALLAAFADRDAEGAAALMSSHISNALAEILPTLSGGR